MEGDDGNEGGTELLLLLRKKYGSDGGSTRVGRRRHSSRLGAKKLRSPSCGCRARRLARSRSLHLMAATWDCDVLPPLLPPPPYLANYLRKKLTKRERGERAAEAAAKEEIVWSPEGGQTRDAPAFDDRFPKSPPPRTNTAKSVSALDFFASGSLFQQHHAHTTSHHFPTHYLTLASREPKSPHSLQRTRILLFSLHTQRFAEIQGRYL